ncbi:MAG: HipA domain-containing protein [Candidatus Omnitrophota bacterium]
MCLDCIDVSDWIEWPLGGTTGSRDKVWLIKLTSLKEEYGNIEIEDFLFKQSHRNYPVEFWSEVITHEIGKMVGVPTPTTVCARRGEVYGALIKSFLKTKVFKWEEEIEETQILNHGGDLLLAQDPTFDRLKGRSHNIYSVERVFVDGGKEAMFPGLLKILVFDVLIGNTDRHQDNWGFTVDDDGGQWGLAPAFDNSDCLGREIREVDIPLYLGNKNGKFEKYIRRGMPHMRWSDDGKNLERLDHFKFLERLSRRWPKVVEYVKLQTSFNDKQVDEILTRVSATKLQNPIFVLSPERVQFIKKIICSRRDLMMNQVGI